MNQNQRNQNIEGLVHVYTGNGKGKTTAALGLALRAHGAGLKVCMIQFMKGYNYGELEAVKNLPNFEIMQFGRPDFVNRKEPEEIDKKLAETGMNACKEVINSKKYDVVILDEIIYAVNYNLVKLEDVMALIDTKPGNLELILTGRDAHQEIMERADYVTEMKEIKHPYKKNVRARKGIEY